MSKCRISRVYRLSLLTLSVMLPIAVISGCSRSKSGSTRMPVINPPVIKMPSPNAYDYFIAAGKALKSANDIKRAAMPMNQSKTYSESDIAALVKENQTALEKLREGLKYDYQQPFKYGMDAKYPEYEYYRSLSYLLVLESRVKMSKGDWPDAVDSCQDGLMLGEMVAYGDGNSMGRLVGIACQKAASRRIWDAIPHLTGAQAKAAVNRMQEIQNHHFPLHESLEVEKNAQLLWLQDVFAGKCKDPDLKSFTNMSGRAKSKAINDYTKYMDQCIKNIQMPYASKPAFPEMEEPKGILKYYNRDALADIMLCLLCSDIHRLWFADTCSQTRKDLLTVSFALQAYHADHGNYPAKLSELCPEYLKSIPYDLFALKAPLSYRRDGDKYVLWSVGSDCVNNNGTPVVDPKTHNAFAKYSVHDGDKGDFVAGINM